MDKQITRTELIHKGKANNVYSTNDPRYLELEASDRVSAGNGVKTDVISNKGIANNQISSATFKYLEDYGIPTHYVCEGSNPASKIVLKADMIPLEVIVRNMATGSFCKRYGVSDGSYFTEPFIEYTFKCDSSGDPPIDRETILALGPEYSNIRDKRELYLIEYYAWRICELLTDFYEKLDVELIDFKVVCLTVRLSCAMKYRQILAVWSITIPVKSSTRTGFVRIWVMFQKAMRRF